MEGRKHDSTFYPVIFGAGVDEDWTSPKVWLKANPSLGETIGIDKVKAACESARQNPGEENAFRQLRLNQWVKQSIRWMPMEKWDACAFPVDEDELEGRVCYGGLDLSSTTDLTSDAKLFLIKMQQEDKRGHSTVKTVRGVLRPAFQMAVDDDVLMKNPFQFELAGVVVNDSVTREAVTKDQMRKFLRFVHDDILYCKYYEVVYILFHTGMRISEFCGLTLKDIDLKNKTVNIDHQLQRTSKREYVIEPTKTNAGTRVIPITDEVAEMFRSIIEDRPKYKVEKVVAGYSGFLFLDKDGMPLVAMHWEHRFNSMVGRYNEIYKVQIPNITPHVCRHTYCSNQAKAGMNPKTLQYLMGHSDIAVTLNVYTHVGLEDAENELRKMQTLEGARKEMGLSDKDDKPLKQTMFKVV